MIITNVSTDNVVPTTFHVFNFLRAAGSLISIPFTVAIIATKSASGTAVVGNTYDFQDVASMDVLAGANSEGSIMCRQAALCAQLFGGGPRVVATFVAEPGGGTANVQLITCVGTATADGNQTVRVAGRPFTVGVHAGDSQNTNAAAIANALKLKAESLPVIVTVATNVVTLTHPTKGVNGGQVPVSVDQQVAGMVATVTTSAAGAGAADVQPGLTALSPLRYDGIAVANHTSADITEIMTDIAGRWAPESKNWGFYYVGELGTIGTATALAAAANHQAVIISCMEGCLSAPGEMAVASAMLVNSRARPNAGFDGAIVPLYPPTVTGTLFTPGEQNTGIKAGLTVFVGVVDSSGRTSTNRAKCVQMVTSKTTVGGNPDDRCRDIAVPRTGVSLAIQLDAASADALGAERNPDGVNQEDSEKLIRDLASAILRAEARASPPVLSPSKVEADVASIGIEPDVTVLGRNNVLLPYHPETPLHQVAYVHNVIIG